MSAKLERVVTVEPNRVVSLPIEWWGLEDLAPGETVVLSRLCAGLVQVRRPLPTAGMSYDDVLDAFGDLLRRQGYDTKEKVIALMKEIKREVAEEWRNRARSE
ncbi:MAG: hypothetical protein H8D74_02230 [Chloroflexi bacterium]|nr:hypothetical protein [Chloroflexota bacterium]